MISQPERWTAATSTISKDTLKEEPAKPKTVERNWQGLIKKNSEQGSEKEKKTASGLKGSRWAKQT